jgi:hypothetical protein
MWQQALNGAVQPDVSCLQGEKGCKEDKEEENQLRSVDDQDVDSVHGFFISWKMRLPEGGENYR